MIVEAIKIPPPMMYSLKNGIRNIPARMARWDLTPGKVSAKPQLSVLKQAKAPKLMMPCG